MNDGDADNDDDDDDCEDDVDDDDVLQDNGKDQLPRLEERAICEHSWIQRTQPHTSLALQGIFIRPMMMMMMTMLIILIIIIILVNDYILSTVRESVGMRLAVLWCVDPLKSKTRKSK